MITRTLTISLLLGFLWTTTFSQTWTKASGTDQLVVRSIITYNADTLLAGVDDQGVYISYDDGISWQSFALNGESVLSLVRVGDQILAGTDGRGIFTSTLSNPNWIRSWNNNLSINSFRLNSDTIYACTHGNTGPGGLYYSTDTAMTWTQYASVPPFAYLQVDFGTNGRTLVATPQGAYHSDNQSPWTQTSGFGTTVLTVHSLGNDSVIYGDLDGIYLSVDNGASAQQISGIIGGSVFRSQDTIFVATVGTGIFYATQVANAWTSLNFNDFAITLHHSPGKLLAGTGDGIYFRGNLPTHSDENTIRDEGVIFPNPVQDKLFVLPGDIAMERLELFDVEGRAMISTGQEQWIDVSELPSGIYFYRIYYDDGGAIEGKIIKE